jgi:hypothetical protein
MMALDLVYFTQANIKTLNIKAIETVANNKMMIYLGE